MNRTTPLAAALLLGAALLSPSGAIAAGETCRGEAATIVGRTSVRTLNGTPGRDVVVTEGSGKINTYAGDDLICITGELKNTTVVVDAGPGDDIVDATAASRYLETDVTLGTGSDVFAGGAAHDDVLTGELGADLSTVTDVDVDVVSTGGGPDSVQSGQEGQPNGDVIDLGIGDDWLSWEGTSMLPGASIKGGRGFDRLGGLGGPGENVIDNVAGTFHENSNLVASWTGFEWFDVGSYPDSTAITFAGSPINEWLTISGTTRSLLTADLGGGNDYLIVEAAPRPGSRIAGGAGDDRLYTGTTTGDLKLDMRRGKLWVGRGEKPLRVTDFRGAALFARHVRATGDGHDNDLLGLGCRVTLDGKGGNDRLEVTHDYELGTYKFGCTPKSLMFGRRGKDYLRGSKGRDRLFGGPGHDTLEGRGSTDLLLGGQGWDKADGGNGTDRCVAEKKKNCEL